MSHVTTVSNFLIPEDSLSDFAAACPELGLVFHHGQRTHRWYGKFMSDWDVKEAAVNMGFNPQNFGKCEHAVSLAGDPKAYEIGLVRVSVKTEPDGSQTVVEDKNGKCFAPVLDIWGPGQPMAKACGGASLKDLAYAYGRRVITRVAAARRMTVQERVLADGTRQLVAVQR